jgi:hypothetical protein
MDGPKLLRDFGKSTLLHVKNTKDRAPCSDQIDIGPLHCDPMNINAPLPKLLISFDLEDFLSV